MSLFKMAWRNVWRNPRRSVVTIAAMTLALWTMILYSGLVEGYLGSMEGDIIDMEVGDIQIFAEGYQDKPSLYTAVEDLDALLGRFDDAGYPASARLMAGGLAASGEFSSGVLFRGIDVDRDATVSLIHEQLTLGAWLEPTDLDGVVLGKRLAKTLAVQPGDELIALTQASDGSIANALFTVRGVLGSVGEGTDRAAVIMTEAAFRDLMVFPEGAHQLIVRRGERLLPDAAAEVRAIAGDGLDVKTWRELMPTIAQMLDSTRGLIYMVFFIVYIAIGILLLNAMLMAVFERIREFGVMKALGVGPSVVFRLILAEAAVQTLLALVAALLLSIPAAWYMTVSGIPVGSLSDMSIMGLTFEPVLMGDFTVQTYTGPIVVMLVIVSIAVIFPAIRAARLKPVDAMRHR